MGIFGRRQKGLSLIEMLIALVIGAIIIAGVYRTFTVQQKTFTVQEQVSEAQQNVRAVMDLIARDIRMAGFGKPGWPVEGISETVTVTVGANPAPNREVNLELVGAFGSPLALLDDPAAMGGNQITLDRQEELSKDANLLVFEQYYDSSPSGDPIPAPVPSIRYANMVVWSDTPAGGSATIDIDGNGSTTGTRDGLEADLRADDASDTDRQVFSQVYRVERLTYHWAESSKELRRNTSLLAGNVKDFQVTDVGNGSYQITLTVETRTNDPDFAGGHRERTLTSTIRARNVVTS